jgi:hypothetical protein
MGLDQGGIDHRDGVAGVREGLGHVFPIHAGRFQAYGSGGGRLLDEPGGQRRMALRGVGDGLGEVLAFRAVLDQQGAVEFGLGDIDAEKRRGRKAFSHGSGAIYLVNAGCRLSRAKLLFDLSLRK